MHRLSVLFVGHVDRPEFRGAFRWLRTHSILHDVAGIDEATELLAEGKMRPELIVVAKSRPGEVSSAQLDGLRRMAPLARITGLLGSWCEGEPRSGRVWPGVYRSYWYHWPARIAKDLPDIATGRCPAWGLPVTSTDDEYILFSAGQPPTPHRGLVAIVTESTVTSEGLSDACRQAGYATVCIAPDQIESSVLEGPSLLISDCGPLDHNVLCDIQRLAARHHPAPVISLILHPRPEDIDRVRSAGAAAVVAKPFMLDDLYWELDRLANTASIS